MGEAVKQEQGKSKEDLQKEQDDLVRRCIERENKQRDAAQMHAERAKEVGEAKVDGHQDAPGKSLTFLFVALMDD